MDPPAALHARGLLHARQGEFAQALACYDSALASSPSDPELRLNRSTALRGLGRLEAAQTELERILAVHPEHLGAWNNLGTLHLDREDPGAALLCFERALALAPERASLHNHLGIALARMQRHLEAKASYAQAMALAPDWAAPPYHLANLLVGQPGAHDHSPSPAGSLHQAIPLFAHALALEPQHPDAGRNLASLLLELGRVEQAVAVLRRCLQNQLEGTAAGNAAGSTPAAPPAIWSNLLMTLQYLPGVASEALAAEASAWGDRILGWRRLQLGATPLRPPADPQPDRPLRIGYLSGDLSFHPVGLFLRGVLASHDRRRVTPFLYDNGSPEHALRHRLAEGARRLGGDWLAVEALDDRALAERIRADRIDILIDLAGHTARSRLQVFSLRPAPLQLSWLGYFASTGLAAIDAVILDPICAPPAAASQFREPILRLPHCRFVFQPPPFAPPVTSPPVERLGVFSFGCCNNTAKLNGTVLASWARILQAVPDSRLLLQWRTFTDPEVCVELRRTMEAQGVAPERLELRAAVPAYGPFLNTYGEIDLALDPFPFSGGQSSCDALWMGVPLLTLPGSSVISRQSLSFLTCLGLEGELAARDLADYEARAIALAHDRQRLAQLRSELRSRLAASPLCDERGFTGDLERLLHERWQQLLDDQASGRLPLLDLLQQQPDAEQQPCAQQQLDAKQQPCAEQQPSSEPQPCSEQQPSTAEANPTGESDAAGALPRDPHLAPLLRSLRRQPDQPALLRDLGERLRRAQRPDEALICLRRALQLAPGDPLSHYNLASTLHERGDLEAAIGAYRRAISLESRLHQPWVNLGTALVEQGQPKAAVIAFQQALRLQPDLAVAQSNLAKALLTTAHDAASWQQAWQAYEWRFRHRPELLMALPGRRWQGEPLDSDTLVLVAEQGLGDTLMFIRYAQLLRQRFPRLLLHGHRKLAPLLLASGLIDGQLNEPSEAGDAPWVPLLSLPGLLGVSRQQPLETAPYLRADPAAVQRWRQQLGTGDGPLVALHWQGDPRQERLANRGRSLPLESYAPLASIPGIRLVSLQKGPGSEQLASCSFRDQFVSCQEQIDASWGFQDSAAILMLCDQVISADSGLVHLAGGLGLPLRILLQCHPEWRWERQGETCAWYPRARLLHQPIPGDWASVIERVRDDLMQQMLTRAH